jgi:hypothetical protein
MGNCTLAFLLLFFCILLKINQILIKLTFNNVFKKNKQSIKVKLLNLIQIIGQLITLLSTLTIVIVRNPILRL